MRWRGNASLTVMVVVLAVLVGMGAPGPAAATNAATDARVHDATSAVVRPAWLEVVGAKQLRTGVVLEVRPAADVPVRRCEFGLQVSGRYDKPDFTAVMREEGTATGVTTCGSDVVPAMTVTVTIDDFGMPGGGGHQIVTGVNQGGGPGPVVATAAQNVNLVEAPPPDNYRIEWTFRLSATSVDGQQATACGKLQAVFPGSVTSASC